MNPHSNEWYDKFAGIHKRYFYPWRSVLTPKNGEDSFLRILLQPLKNLYNAVQRIYESREAEASGKYI